VGAVGLVVLTAPAGCSPAADPGLGASGTTASGATGGGGSAGTGAGTAGNAAAGMSAGGVGTAGSSAAGAAGLGAAGSATAGNGASGSGSGGAGIDPGCDYVPLMVMDCAHAGCHAPMPVAAASLNLLPDSGLVARLKDVKAQHLNINCAPPGEEIMECGFVPAACPSDALLVSSTNWESSWLIAKLRGTAVGCGDVMRDPTYLTEKPDREACVEAVVKAIAALPRASVMP
ncbi:MAG TPA: hypothetical protein VNN72_24045, partial [Polyangiaceae bacterium]|nr:hypothetical protein [Polyangiaceae bacterium]